MYYENKELGWEFHFPEVNGRNSGSTFTIVPADSQ